MQEKSKIKLEKFDTIQYSTLTYMRKYNVYGEKI